MTKEISKDYTLSKNYTSRIDCDLVDFDYKVSRFVIKASDRLNKKVFVDHDFKLYNNISEEISLNCFISNYYIWRIIDQDSAFYITYSENFNAKNKSRAIRTNKEKVAKRKLYNVWYYKFVDVVMQLCSTIRADLPALVACLAWQFKNAQRVNKVANSNPAHITTHKNLFDWSNQRQDEMKNRWR